MEARAPSEKKLPKTSGTEETGEDPPTVLVLRRGRAGTGEYGRSSRDQNKGNPEVGAFPSGRFGNIEMQEMGLYQKNPHLRTWSVNS